MGNGSRNGRQSSESQYVAMRPRESPTIATKTPREFPNIAMTTREVSEHRCRNRVRGQVVVFLFSMLCMIPVISKRTWSPVVTGDCRKPVVGDLSLDVTRHGHLSLDVTWSPVVGGCRVHPHSKQDMWFACAMLIIAKIFTLDTSGGFTWEGFKLIVKQCLGMVAEYKEKPLWSGYLEWLLAIWNNLCAATFSCVIVIQEHESKFTNGDLEPLFVRGSWFLTETGNISAADDCKAFGTTTDGLVDGALSYFGGIHLFLFMMGALFISLAEIMKMDISDKFLIKDFIDIDVLLRQNRRLKNSRLMANVKEAQDEVLRYARRIKDLGTPACGNEQISSLVEQALNNLEASILESIDKDEVINFILKTDLSRVTWPFVLQASAFALWIAVDYVVLDPCVKFDSDIETKVLFGMIDLAGHFLPVMIWMSLVVIALGPIMMLASFFCELAHEVLFCSLALYAIVFGTFQKELATTTDAASNGTATANRRLDDFTADHIGAFFLLQLGLRPLNYERLIMVSYAGQCLLRQLVRLRSGCCKSMEPTDAQIKHFEDNVIKPMKMEILDSILVEVHGSDDVLEIAERVVMVRNKLLEAYDRELDEHAAGFGSVHTAPHGTMLASHGTHFA